MTKPDPSDVERQRWEEYIRLKLEAQRIELEGGDRGELRRLRREMRRLLAD